MRAHQPVNADVIKVPHHGSANLDPGFSEWAGGSIAVISVGADNDYGHPSRESLETWRGASTFRTDLQGAIAISVGDSSELQVTTKR
jgi:competence protein ComEC